MINSMINTNQIILMFNKDALNVNLNEDDEWFVVDRMFSYDVDGVEVYGVEAEGRKYDELYMKDLGLHLTLYKMESDAFFED